MGAHAIVALVRRDPRKMDEIREILGEDSRNNVSNEKGHGNKVGHSPKQSNQPAVGDPAALKCHLLERGSNTASQN